MIGHAVENRKRTVPVRGRRELLARLLELQVVNP